jgi:hypothetical protein
MTAVVQTRGQHRFTHVARMEWIKLRSLRSTWWTLAVTAAAAVGLAVLPRQVGESGDGWAVADRGVGPVMVVLV